MLERFNGELRRRIRVIRIFRSAASCVRLTRELAVETHERWLDGEPLSEHGRTNMKCAGEQCKEALRQAT